MVVIPVLPLITTGITFVLTRHFFRASLARSWYFSIFFSVIVIVVGIVICCYFCFAFPGIAANSSGDTGLRIEEWWEMFKNVGGKKKKNRTSERADGRTDERTNEGNN